LPKLPFAGASRQDSLGRRAGGWTIKGAEPNHYAYIDALRGYAVLAVVATHVQDLTPDLPFVVKRLADFGSMGVLLFFVVSAFTLSASWTRRNDGAVAFYIRRLFRIAPAFLDRSCCLPRLPVVGAQLLGAERRHWRYGRADNPVPQRLVAGDVQYCRPWRMVDRD